jgi:hypothetical protein
MATEILLGSESDGTTNDGAGYFTLAKFTALLTGTMTEIHVYSKASGHVKVAIYADNGGEPGSRITANNSGQAVTLNQWNTLSINATPIVKDTVYWLAFNIDTAGAVSAITSDGIKRYKAATYSTFTFPDPAGTGFSNDTYKDSIAGWGITYRTISEGGKLGDNWTRKIVAATKGISEGSKLGTALAGILAGANIYPKDTVHRLTSDSPALEQIIINSVATLDVDLPMFTCEARGGAQLDGKLPFPIIEASAINGNRGVLDVALPFPTIEATGYCGITGLLDEELPFPTLYARAISVGRFDDYVLRYSRGL